MKRIIFLIAIFATMLLAEEICNNSGSNSGIPEGSCSQIGYVCNLAFDVNGSQKVMAFYLYNDATCATPSITTLQTFDTQTKSTTNRLRIFMIEGAEYDTDALGMTLAGSMALSAYNNRTHIGVIYSKKGNNQYGGIRLLAISSADN
jgi:hypothetical protein